MKIIRCDKCGKEIPQKEWIDVPLIHIEIMEATYLKPISVDLCDECKTALCEWLGKEYKDKGEE